MPSAGAFLLAHSGIALGAAALLFVYPPGLAGRPPEYPDRYPVLRRGPARKPAGGVGAEQ